MSRYIPERIERDGVLPLLYDMSQWRVHFLLRCHSDRCPNLEGVVKGKDMRLGSSLRQHR